MRVFVFVLRAIHYENCSFVEIFAVGPGAYLFFMQSFGGWPNDEGVLRRQEIGFCSWK
jgi:hypothetical protein